MTGANTQMEARMRNMLPILTLMTIAAGLLAPTPARPDEFGALPERLEPSGEAASPKPDFRDLLRKAAPITPAQAAEPPPPAPEAAPSPPAAADTGPAPDASAPAAANAAPASADREPKRPAATKPARPLQRGLAAWYQHPGRTASGQIYNPNGLTAAHRTLPLGTRLRVVYEKTGKAVTVRVTDRISLKALSRRKLALELSRGGARAIGLEGVGMVAIYRAGD
jgi:rare lipoprotein A